MAALGVFSVTLLVAMLVSELADRSVLSTAVLFLGAGVLAGPVLGFIRLDPDDAAVVELARFALVSVLFTDAMRTGVHDLRRAWRLPGAALFFGLPLTLLGTGLAAHYLAGVAWPGAMLIGAVLSPTDPVFAAAIVGREEIPVRLRHLLNVESGLNDGLALPLVLVLLPTAGGASVPPLHLVGTLAGGVVIGVVVPWIVCRLVRFSVIEVAERRLPVFTLSIGMVVMTAAALLGLNEYLAVFAAGVTIATVRPELRGEFESFGESLTELLKFAALLAFGALISPALLGRIGWGGWLFCLLALVAVRPAALALALARSRLPWRERLTAGWFGPKGFASVVYGVLVLRSHVPNAPRLFQLVAVVIAASIVAHSSSDVPIARYFRRLGERRAAADAERRPPPHTLP